MVCALDKILPLPPQLRVILSEFISKYWLLDLTAFVRRVATRPRAKEPNKGASF